MSKEPSTNTVQRGAKLDLKNIEKQVKKAQNIIAGIGKLKKNKFVRLELRGKS